MVSQNCTLLLLCASAPFASLRETKTPLYSGALLTFNHSFTADHVEMQHMKKTA
jgi:hypothetical protein